MPRINGQLPYELYAGSLTSPSKVTGRSLNAVLRLEVTLSEDGQSGCQITFATGRATSADLDDDQIAGDTRFHPGSRIVVVARAADVTMSIFDGVITQAEYAPSHRPTQSRFFVRCLDLTELMGRKQIRQSYPRQHEGSIARTIIEKYAQYGIQAEIGPMPYAVAPSETDWIPMQNSTDRAYLMKSAAFLGFQFCLIPGPQPRQSVAYWGPPKRSGAAQKALTVDMAPATNVNGVRFQYNGLAATVVEDRLHARGTNAQGKVIQKSSTIERLANEIGLDLPDPIVGSRFLRTPFALDEAQADAHAQALVDRSLDDVLTASGEVVSSVYGDILMPYGQVDMRGPGNTYNGTYHVQSVTHLFDEVSYTQQFTICREGTGGTKAIVNVNPFLTP